MSKNRVGEAKCRCGPIHAFLKLPAKDCYISLFVNALIDLFH